MEEIQRFQGLRRSRSRPSGGRVGVGEVVAAVESDVVVAVAEDGVEHVGGFPHCGREMMRAPYWA